MKRTAHTSSARRSLLALLAAAGCASADPQTQIPDADDAQVAREVTAMLHASAEAWNRGDLEAFLADYDEDATFVGSSGLIRGVDEIRRRYVASYWSTGEPPDLLRFDIIDVTATGPHTATALGRYTLRSRDSGDRTGTGFFTLLLERNTDGWKILHDHSSAEDGG